MLYWDSKAQRLDETVLRDAGEDHQLYNAQLSAAWVTFRNPIGKGYQRCLVTEKFFYRASGDRIFGPGVNAGDVIQVTMTPNLI